MLEFNQLISNFVTNKIEITNIKQDAMKIIFECLIVLNVVFYLIRLI